MGLFFTMEKENPKLIGFTKRSRKKFKHLYHNETLLVTYAAGVIEYIGKEMATEIILKETAIEKFAVQRANEQGAILSQKRKSVFFISPLIKLLFVNLSGSPSLLLWGRTSGWLEHAKPSTVQENSTALIWREFKMGH